MTGLSERVAYLVTGAVVLVTSVDKAGELGGDSDEESPEGPGEEPGPEEDGAWMELVNG